MRIKSELLWGASIRNKSKIYDLLQAGKLPSGYFLLLCTPDRKMEFIPSKMQSNRYYMSKECTVFGIARGRREAEEMVCSILTDIYTKYTYSSMDDFVGKVLGESIC